MSEQQIKSKCLILNSDFTPIKVISWQQAMIIDFKYKNNKSYPVDIIQYHGHCSVAVANGKTLAIPAIIKLNRYLNLYKNKVNFSRKNLFIRDNFLCQYCGNSFPNSQLTYDHVIPKCRYKPNLKNCTNWNNVVTSCRNCNAKKANKTPQEAGMALLKNPYVPKYDTKYLSWHVEMHTISKDDPCYELWKPYL